MGFGLAKLGGLAFCALVAKLVNMWSNGFWAILVRNCHRCIQNDVWKVCLKKEFILVGFWHSQVGWIAFFALVAKLVNKWSHVFEQSWWGIVTNTSKMRCEKFGCERNWSWLGFGLAMLGVLAFWGLVAKFAKN